MFLYLEEQKKMKKSISLTIEENIIKQVEKLAKKENKSFSSKIEAILKGYINAQIKTVEQYLGIMFTGYEFISHAPNSHVFRFQREKMKIIFSTNPFKVLEINSEEE